jgi:hypothetical protein
MKRNLVYVERTIITTEIHAMIVIDDDDLKKQLLEHEASIRDFKYVGKAAKNKAGKTEFHELNSNWDV